jgi:hypothetical protein
MEYPVSAGGPPLRLQQEPAACSVGLQCWPAVLHSPMKHSHSRVCVTVPLTGWVCPPAAPSLGQTGALSRAHLLPTVHNNRHSQLTHTTLKLKCSKLIHQAHIWVQLGKDPQTGPVLAEEAQLLASSVTPGLDLASTDGLNAEQNVRGASLSTQPRSPVSRTACVLSSLCQVHLPKQLCPTCCIQATLVEHE